MTAKLDKASTVNLGILGTLLVSAIGGATYLTTLNSNVVALGDGMVEVKKAIDRNTAQLVVDGRALAVLETVVGTLDRRLGDLEKAKGR